MKSPLTKFAFTFPLLCVIWLQSAKAQDNQFSRWDNGIRHSSWDLALSLDEDKKLRSLWDEIGADLKTEKNELAGTYLKDGYDNGYFMRWSVNKGYVLIPYFDQNLIADFGFGKVTFVDNSKMVFTPERDLKGGRGLSETYREWTAIWNYLVPVVLLKEFGEFHAGFGQFNEFNGQCCDFVPDFLARRIDRKEIPFSYPVPSRYARFIKEASKGQITFVGKKRTVKDWGYNGKLYSQWMEKAVLIPVKINIGRKDGVKRNTLFRLIDEPNNGQYLQIMTAKERTSEGFIVRDISFDGKETYYDWETDKDKSLPPIRVGIRVTTSPTKD